MIYTFFPALSVGKEYQNVYRSDHLASHLWESDGELLNLKQREAITHALAHRFQLIQGPPGIYTTICSSCIGYIVLHVQELVKV